MSTICRKAIGTFLPKRPWSSRTYPKTSQIKKKTWFAQEKAPANPVSDKKSWKNCWGLRERIRERGDRRRKRDDQLRKDFRRLETKEYFREMGSAVLKAFTDGAKAMLPVVGWTSCVALLAVNGALDAYVDVADDDDGCDDEDGNQDTRDVDSDVNENSWPHSPCKCCRNVLKVSFYRYEPDSGDFFWLISRC